MAKKEYDWIEEPFKEEVSQREGMSGKSKILIGCGCLLAFVVAILLAVGLFSSFMSLMEG